MPVEGAQKTIENQKPENPLENFRVLEMRKKVLTERILSATDLTKKERDELVFRVFEHSTEDGLDLADALSLGREERIAAITNYKFVQKHPEFALRLANKLREYQVYAGADDEMDLTDFADILGNKVTRMKKGKFLEFRKPTSVSDNGEKLLQEVDAYYTDFVRFQKVAEKEAPFDQRSKGEKIGEELLEIDMLSLGPHYHTDPIRALTKSADPRLTFQSVIPLAELKPLLAESGVDLKNEAVRQQLERARFRPLGITHKIRHQAVELKLREEIVESLTRRGFKENEFALSQDEATQKFQVLDKSKKGKEFKKENLRLVAEIPDTFIMQPDDPYYEKMKGTMQGEYTREKHIDQKTGALKLESYPEVLDGKIYQEVGANKHTFILYPDGRRSDIFYAIQGKKTVGKRGLIFMINDFRNGHRNNFQLTIDGKRINEDDAWDVGNEYVEAEDGSIYYDGRKRRGMDWAGDSAILKDGQMLTAYPVGSDFIRNLTLIDNKLVYTIDKGNNQSSLIFGDKTFGPYKSVMMPKENRTLSFVAEKENGERILYIDGVQYAFSAEGEIVDIVKAGRDVYVMMARVIEKENRAKNLNHDRKTYWIVDQDGNKITDESEGLKGEYADRGNFWSVEGKLVYTIEQKNELGESRRILHWGKKEKDVTELGDITPAGILNGDLFFYSSSGVYSFKSDNVDFGENLIGWESVKIENGKLRITIREKDKNSRVYEYSPGLVLTEDERRKIELLNALKAEMPEKIYAYFEKYYPQEVVKGFLEKLKDTLTHSGNFAKTMMEMIKESPALFLDTLKAKKDDLTERNIDQFVTSIFPELRTNSEKARREAERNRRSGMSARGFYAGSRETNDFDGGDPMEKDNPELLHLREPMSEFLSTGVYGKYNQARKTWEQIGFSLSGQSFGPTQEITAEIPVSDGMEEVILPKCLNASIIPERVKGILENGEEMTLEVAINTLGEARVKVPKGVKKILYSQTVQELPVVPEDLSAESYARFKADAERRFGKEVTEKIAALPEELLLFLESLKVKSPAEKLEEIESFVRSLGFYDFKNKEVQSLKKDKSLEETIVVMAGRMKELRRQNPMEAEKMAHKKYAGVCSDFAKLTAALLREAGFISGLAGGLQPAPGEKVLTTAHAHAIAFALWPAENGKAKVIALDGTPGGTNEAEEALLAGMRQKSLSERRKMFESEKDKVTTDAEKTLAELEELVKHLDEGAIKKLQNGELERVLNIILGEVRSSHLAVVDRVLNASRYAGFDVGAIVKKDHLETEIKLRQFLEAEIQKERGSERENAFFKGADLLRVIDEFVARYSQDKGVKGKTEALDIIEKVLDISKQNLSPIESRSAVAVVTYLKARKMGNG